MCYHGLDSDKRFKKKEIIVKKQKKKKTSISKFSKSV